MHSATGSLGSSNPCSCCQQVNHIDKQLKLRLNAIFYRVGLCRVLLTRIQTRTLRKQVSVRSSFSKTERKLATWNIGKTWFYILKLYFKYNCIKLLICKTTFVKNGFYITFFAIMHLKLVPTSSSASRLETRRTWATDMGLDNAEVLGINPVSRQPESENPSHKTQYIWLKFSLKHLYKSMLFLKQLRL